MAANKECTDYEVDRLEESFRRVASDLSMIADRDFEILSVKSERVQKRPAGRGKIHISFKLGFRREGGVSHGCLLMPLPDAISMACYLMMVPDDAVKSKRSLQSLDSGTKDAMLEVCSFIGGATDAALRATGLSDVKVGTESCQGVKTDVRPALLYMEGDDLIVGRARSKLHDFPEFEMILVLPNLGPPTEE